MAALGRRLGSLLKHSSKKFRSIGESPSGMGGLSSSTIRNITRSACQHTCEQLGMIDVPVSPLGMSPYGGRPVSSSITTQPRDQISDLVEAPWSSITSGATIIQRQKADIKEDKQNSLQFGVPATSLTFSIACKFSDTPKSESLTLPFLVVRILAALRSQCTTDDLWR